MTGKSANIEIKNRPIAFTSLGQVSLVLDLGADVLDLQQLAPLLQLRNHFFFKYLDTKYYAQKTKFSYPDFKFIKY